MLCQWFDACTHRYLSVELIEQPFELLLNNALVDDLACILFAALLVDTQLAHTRAADTELLSSAKMCGDTE